MTHRPDSITVKDEGKKFAPHPEGTFPAVCVDVIDLGERVETWDGKEKLSYKIALVFDAGEDNADTGERFYIHPEFTASMGQRAALRAFLESWRGKSYTDDQARQGIPVDKLVGAGALLTIEHKTSASGRTYAKVRSVSPLPKGMGAPPANGYARPEFWATRKAEYAEAAARFKATTRPTTLADMPEALADDDGDDDLPF